MRRTLVDLRKYREDRGLSLRALAQQIGISVTPLFLIENGYGRQVSFRMKAKIAAALHCPLLSLFPELAVELDALFKRRPGAADPKKPEAGDL
jgi:transcriptional regulator with XRE-family HTH domain